MDHELLLRVRAGDRMAFDVLVAEKAQPLYRTALAILGNEADARDAAQSALVAVWRGIGGLRDLDRFEAWLGRIVVNHCRSVLRRRIRVREVSLDEASDQPITSDRDDATAFDEAFARLSVDQRAILVLHHLEGYGVNEIAARIGVPAGTMKWRLSRARKALQRELDRE